MSSSSNYNALMKKQGDLAAQQTDLGNLLKGQGQRVFNMSAPAYNTGLNFFRTLVTGGPQALRQQMSTENSLVNQVYSGAKLGLEHSGMRGGTGDQARAALERQRTSQLAGMVPSMRSGAAEKLMQGGLSGFGASQGFGSSAVTGLGNAGLSYASMANNEQARSQANQGLWTSLGGGLASLLMGGGGGGALGGLLSKLLGGAPNSTTNALAALGYGNIQGPGRG